MGGGGRESASGYLEGKGVNIVVYLDDVWYAAEHSTCNIRRGVGDGEREVVMNHGNEKIIESWQGRDEVL